jgi:hypothetical protein
MLRRLISGICFLLVGQLLYGQSELFEKKIRPVLATNCYGCHSSKLKSPIGGLELDTNAGLHRVVGKIVTALRYSDPNLQMPPTGKLPDSVIADFEAWIAAGAVDPRVDAASTGPAPLKGMSLEDGRKWWAFQPVRAARPPAGIDSLVLAKLKGRGMKPSPRASARDLITRASIDLLGLRPTYEEVDAFVNDKSPDAWPKLVDRLLASPHYGEQWGRHWMDVARFGEDNPTSEATNPPYPFAWRYRDWIIEAVNKDVPYDRFVKLQLAADQMAEKGAASRSDLRALGYLGAAPVYHKDQRLSAEVIGGFMTDDWDERVDAVSRGVLAMTVACARCHDHKFDPIPTKDYYGLVGVFASTMRAERPLFDIDPKVEQRYLWIENRLFDLHYSVNLLTTEASTVEDSAPRVAKWTAEIESLKAEMGGLAERYPALVENVQKYYTVPPAKALPAVGPTAPFANAVYDAAQFLDGSDAHYTWIDYRPGVTQDFPVLLHGNVATPGEVVPRHFLSVLSKQETPFGAGSGRLELADRIFGDGASLAARVIVNRVWGWHFGRALVPTTSDFGVQGEKPSNPALLDDLAARFIAHGWSMKWLHREIMLSATYRQSSHPRAEAEAIDQQNTLLWRMTPRRLDIEAYRDSILRAAGTLSEEMYGPSQEADARDNVRRTVYARVSRSRLSDLLRIYDFPDPVQTSSERDVTTTSLQQLFVMNSAFIHTQAAALADGLQGETDNAAKIRGLYRKILSRNPDTAELDRGVAYLSRRPDAVAEYAQILFSVNEEIFWP